MTERPTDPSEDLEATEGVTGESPEAADDLSDEQLQAAAEDAEAEVDEESAAEDEELEAEPVSEDEAEAEALAASGGVPAGLEETRPRRLGARAAAEQARRDRSREAVPQRGRREPKVQRTQFPIDPALRIRDPWSTFFVALCLVVFAVIFLNAMLLGHGGAFTTPHPTPSPAVSASPGPSGSPGASGSPGPSGSAAPGPSGSAAPASALPSASPTGT